LVLNLDVFNTISITIERVTKYQNCRVKKGKTVNSLFSIETKSLSLFSVYLLLYCDVQ